MSSKILTNLFRALLVVLLIMALVPASDLFAGSAKTISGKINTIDTVKRKVNIKLSDGSAVTLKVPLIAKITRNGSGTVLGNLVLRDTVIVKYDSATKNTVLLRASGPKLSRSSGQVMNVLRASGIVKIGMKSFKTDANTKISRNGKVVSLGHLTRKDNVSVHTLLGTVQMPLAVDIIGNGPDESEVEGIIIAVDIFASKVTIKPDNGTADVTLTVDTNTMIEVNDQPATLANLLINMEVEAEYHPSTLIAYSIETQENNNNVEVKGTVAAVDLTLGTITINPSDGTPPMTLTVNASTEIEVNDASATLAEVLVGMPVTAEYDTATMIATKVRAGNEDQGDDEDVADVEGIVTALTANSVTIAPGQNEDGEQQNGDMEQDGDQNDDGDLSPSGEPITLIIDASTEIRLCDGPGTINDILIGQKIEAEYDNITIIAKKIKICAEGDNEGDGD
jgi:predicted RNA-binding protein